LHAHPVENTILRFSINNLHMQPLGRAAHVQTLQTMLTIKDILLDKGIAGHGR